MNFASLPRALTCAALLVVGMNASAQDRYPNKPLRMVVPLAAGGPSDAIARALAKGMTASLGQEVLVENRTGGNMGIGAAAVLDAPADGYTLLFGGNPGLPLLSKKSPYKSLTEFTPISTVGGLTQCLVVHKDVAGATLTEFAAEAKKRAQPLQRGANSPAEDMVAGEIVKALGLSLERVPYRGSAQMMPDLLAGRVQAAVLPVPVSTPHVRSGNLKNLGCSSAQRLAALPDVPTLAEGGVMAAPLIVGHFVLAPPKLADDIAQRLAAAVRSAAETDDFRRELDRLMVAPQALTPAQTRTRILEAEAQYARFVGETGASID